MKKILLIAAGTAFALHAAASGAPGAAVLPPKASAAVTNSAAMTEAKAFKGAGGGTLLYRIHSPTKIENGRRYPLVLFLHGAGERGADNAMQLVWGVWPILSYMKEKGIEGYVVAPQCPNGEQWVDTPWSNPAHRMPEKPSRSMALVMELLDDLVKELPVDANRVRVTGISMGGYGTWDIVQRRPELFAAAMPMCGGGDDLLAWKIRSVPIWTFHGDKDTAVPVVRSRQMVSALWQCGGNVRYREYPGMGHGCWIRTYQDPEVLDWFFSRSKR